MCLLPTVLSGYQRGCLNLKIGGSRHRPRRGTYNEDGADNLLTANFSRQIRKERDIKFFSVFFPVNDEWIAFHESPLTPSDPAR